MMDTMTDNRETYEGWSNRETWAANLWLSNDEGLYNQTREQAAEALRTAEDDAGDIPLERIARYQLANELKAQFEDWEADIVDGEAPQGIRQLVLDIGSLYRVDWHEVAEGWIASAIEEREADQ